jgi:hypothetical protein
MLLFLVTSFATVIFNDFFNGDTKWDGDINMLNCTNNRTMELDIKCPYETNPYIYFKTFPYPVTLQISSAIVLPTYTKDVVCQVLYEGVSVEAQNMSINLMIGNYTFPSQSLSELNDWSYLVFTGDVPEEISNNTFIEIKMSYNQGISNGSIRIASILLLVTGYYSRPVSHVLTTGEIVLICVGAGVCLLIISFFIVYLIRNRCRIFEVCRCCKKYEPLEF